MAAIISINVTPESLINLENHYADYQVESQNEYALFEARKNGVIITVYRLHKNGYHKVTFAGKNNDKEARIFDSSIIEVLPLVKERIYIEDYGEQIGSDEVGTGDFFGPISVAASYVSKKDIKKLQELGVTDSKKMSDELIRKIGPTLIHEFEYSQVSLDNKKFNELIKNGHNMNSIKALMHNQVLSNLSKKHKNVGNIYVDQFVSPTLYYEYVSSAKEIVRNITFKTKGELRYPSVALASCIARYSFLQKMDAISKKYKVDIPFGASKKVTSFAKEFLSVHNINALNIIVKMNFKNYQEVLSDSSLSQKETE